MTEGARLLPLLKEEADRAPGSISHLLDCSECRQNHDQEERIDLGCGYEDRSAERPEGLWSHPAYPAELEFDREVAGRIVPGRRVCAGYTCKLPWVGQLVPIRKHWDRGSVADRFGSLSEQVWEWVEDLDAAVDLASEFRMNQGRQK